MSDEDTALTELSFLVNGCRDDPEGKKAKQSLVESYLARTNGNAFDTVCGLHAAKSVRINGEALIRALEWQKPAHPSSDSLAIGDADHPGLYLASTLASFPPQEMRSVAEKYFASNAQNPRVDVVDCLRFINARGFCRLENLQIFTDGVVNWARPPSDGVQVPTWKLLWDEANPNNPATPKGAPTYVTIRNSRGVKANVAFLGSIDDENANLSTPPQVRHCGAASRSIPASPHQPTGTAPAGTGTHKHPFPLVP